MNAEEKNGWNEWAKTMINELVRLDKKLEKTSDEVREHYSELKEFKSVEKDIQEVKEDVKELKELINKQNGLLEKKIEKLQAHQNYTIGIGVAIVTIVGFLLTVIGLLR